MAPFGGPVCEVVTVAKRNLKAGESLDGVGGFCAYGLIDNAGAARAGDALPIGLSEGCIVRRDIPRDAIVSFRDVECPRGRTIETLWNEQRIRWPERFPNDRPARMHNAPVENGNGDLRASRSVRG